MTPMLIIALKDLNKSDLLCNYILQQCYLERNNKHTKHVNLYVDECRFLNKY